MNKKIVKYKVVGGDYMIRMEPIMADKVNKLIKEGWQPYGGIAYDGMMDICYQAMVKYEG